MDPMTSCPATSVPVPAGVVVHGVIQFLHARGFKSIEIHQQLVSVYGEGVMSESMAGRHSLEDESGRSRPSLVTAELAAKVDNAVCEDRHSTVDELHECIP
ncbi:hypothetical protein J437_LFUL006600 [Ladona fulva]|uniref:Uncharacterized protein n=1 Tax=Ladona fulva TaxID=123851 RepID=A0A8K0P7B4_LADFU|nr:hypothetical protein J437_LFUL006600 [Ladona fulva]